MRFRSSSAAQFQSIQTRARMAGALWSKAIRGMLLLWMALTVWVIWYRVGLYRPWLQHEFFGRWILCGILNDTPLLKQLTSRIAVPADGAWYALPSFSAWLNGPEMYGDSFYSWYWHMATGLGGYYGIGTDLFPIGLGALLIAWRLRREPDGADHIRGLRLLSPRQHARELNPYRRRLFGALNRPSGGSGIRLGGSVIPDGMQFEHFAVFGTPGSGKSTTIRQMLRQIQDRREAAIIADVEGESTMEFYNEERGDVMLNPLDARCPFWSPWLEFRDECFAVDVAAMAASLIRGRPRSNNEAFFQDSTRTLIEAIFQVVQERDAKALLDFVALDRDQMHEALKGTPGYPLIDPGADEQGAGILGTASNAIKTFVHLPDRRETTRSWSAREWSQTRKGWVFFPSRPDIQDTIGVLQGVWFDCLVRWLMCTEIMTSEQVWITADELAAMGHQPQIPKLLTRGRKRRIAAVLGFQNVAQLREIYGHEGAVTLTSSPTTKVVLRADEPETARWCSDLIGQHEVERLQMTQLSGLSAYREGVNLSPHRSIEHLVLPGEIQKLEPLFGYLCIAGKDRTTITIPRLHLVKRHPVFIPRTSDPTPLSKEPTEQEILDQITARQAPAVQD